MRQVFKKLRSRAGETIAETLVALLVGTLALMILAGMISATARLVTRSEKKMDDYYAGYADLANPSGTLVSISINVSPVEASGEDEATTVSGINIVPHTDETFKEHVTAYRYAGEE